MNFFVHSNGHPDVARKKATVALRSKARTHADEFARHMAWVDWINEKTGLKDSALALKAELPVNAIYRKRTDGRPLNAVQIRAISDATGLPGPDTYQIAGHAGLAEEAAAYDAAKDVDPITARMVEAALKSRPNAAPWRLKTRAIEGAGYLIGDVVITDPTVAPMAGDAVCAQVYDIRTGTAETVFRIYEAPYLVAVTSDPALRKPMLVDDERVVVRGTVTQSFRARRS